jgi:hypothetical protein
LRVAVFRRCAFVGSPPALEAPEPKSNTRIPFSETRGAKDPLGQRIKQLGLVRQTPLLLRSISECVL